MGWSYSGNPGANELDKYRFLISDTDVTNQILQDEEINYILTTYNNHNARMYMLFDAVVNIFSKDVKKSLGPQSEDPTGKQKYFQDKLEYYKKINAASGLSVPTYSSANSFKKGMHDNV